jgi:hypothetical protein
LDHSKRHIAHSIPPTPLHLQSQPPSSPSSSNICTSYHRNLLQQWISTACGWNPTKPIHDKSAKIHVGDDKVIRESSDPTSQVKILKLPLASIFDNIQQLSDGIIGIVHEKWKHITSQSL